MDSDDRHQLELLPKSEPYAVPITPELVQSIKRLPTLLAAWNHAQNSALMEDKQVYLELGIDGSHWSKIRKGLASPPADERFVRYMDVVRNEIPLIWLVEARGYDWFSLRRRRDSKDRYIAELEQRLADQDRAIRLIVEAQKGASR